MRAVFIKGRSQYDATRIFIDELACAFERAGYQSEVIDATQAPDLGEALVATASGEPIEFAYSIGILGEFRDTRDRSIGQILRAPHILHHVDYPLTHLQRLEATAPEAAVLVVDRSHVETIHSIFGDRFAFVGFGPHGAVGEPVEADENPEVFAARRPVPLLFTGTYYAPETPPWLGQGGLLEAVFNVAWEIASGAEFVPALEAMDRSLRGHGLDPKDPSLAGARKFSSAIHEQVRRERRHALLVAAAKAELPLHLVGAGYEGRFGDAPSFTLLGEASLSVATRLMEGSQLVLSANANFGRGSHERPLTAMLAGAGVATDHGTWWSEQFTENEEIIHFRWKSLDADTARLAALLDEPEGLWRIATAGQRKVMAGHRFDHRVETILAAARAARARRPDLFGDLAA